MARSDPSHDRRILFRLGFVVVLVAGAMGFTVGAKASGPVRIPLLTSGVAVPPGPGLAAASMVLAASVLGALFAASRLVSDTRASSADD